MTGVNLSGPLKFIINLINAYYAAVGPVPLCTRSHPTHQEELMRKMFLLQEVIKIPTV